MTTSESIIISILACGTPNIGSGIVRLLKLGLIQGIYCFLCSYYFLNVSTANDDYEIRLLRCGRKIGRELSQVPLD